MLTSKNLHQFCAIDGGWQMRQGGNHTVAIKYLEDGTRLQTMICHDLKKPFSPGAANRICKQELGLAGGEKQLHEVLRTGVAPVRETAAPEIEDQDQLRAQTAGILLNECNLGRYQLKDMTESEAQAVIVSHRFGTPVGAMHPEQVRTALDTIATYGIDHELDVFQAFEAAGSGFTMDEIGELMELTVQTPSIEAAPAVEAASAHSHAL